MLENRPPIIGGVLWGVYFISFCPKMTLEERITKTKNNSEICRFRRIYILVIPFSKGIFGQNVRKYTPHNWGGVLWGIYSLIFCPMMPLEYSKEKFKMKIYFQKIIKLPKMTVECLF